MTKPCKRWSVNAVSEGRARLALYCEGRPLAGDASVSLDLVTPVHYLLLSIASCFALSCRAILSRRNLGRVAFEVVAIGDRRAAGSPNTLSQISVIAIFRGGVTDAMAAWLMEESKPLCTVANSILPSAGIRYSSRTIQERRTASRTPSDSRRADEAKDRHEVAGHACQYE
jgi:uncharacterized OsmC-like protein